MLIKVGSLYLTLGTFVYDRRGGYIYQGGQRIEVEPTHVGEIEHILDEAIAAQQTIKQQVEAMNKQQAELQAKAQEIAQYEQQLMQKAAQVDAAYTAMQQNKSPVILPPGFGRKHRG